MTVSPKKTSVLVPVVTATLFMFALFTLGYAAYTVFWAPEKPGADLSINRQSFSLVSHKGEPVTAETFTGKPSAFFFGYTHCPEVCPTTLMDMTDVAQELGDKADGAQMVFVSIDPVRDTQEVLAQYMTSFAPQIMGVTGSAEEIDKLAKGLKVFYRQVGEGDAYDFDHMAWIYLFDRDGNFVRTASLHNPNENMAEALIELMQ
jgi:protein SCO1